MKPLTKFIILLILIFGRVLAFAGDRLSETPGLNNLIISTIIVPNGQSNRSSVIDLWAETPDLTTIEDTVDVPNGKAVVISGLISAELHAETPNLDKP